MSSSAKVYLMYHELEVRGRPLCQHEPGYVRYVLSAENFRQQMDWLHANQLQGLSISQALDGNTRPGIVITFDDGCESDLMVAAPILKERGFGATFYITVGFLNRPGYMVPAQVRQLSDAGFDIGCHSMTHPYLSDLREADLVREIVDAKHRLEEMTGRPVVNFSCPGGRWSCEVARIAKQGGYRSVATSRIAANPSDADPYSLARVAIMRGTSLASFQSTCRERGLWKRRILADAQMSFRRVLGNTLYDRLRQAALGNPNGPRNGIS